MPVWSLSDTVRIILKYGFFVTLFLIVILPMASFFISKAVQINNIILSSLEGMASTGGSGFNGCALNLLGVDVLVGSFISMLSSALIFWFVATGGFLTYKLSLKAYNYLFKATT
jgi:hypothetical protein